MGVLHSGVIKDITQGNDTYIIKFNLFDEKDMFYNFSNKNPLDKCLFVYLHIENGKGITNGILQDLKIYKVSGMNTTQTMKDEYIIKIPKNNNEVVHDLIEQKYNMEVIFSSENTLARLDLYKGAKRRSEKLQKIINNLNELSNNNIE